MAGHDSVRYAACCAANITWGCVVELPTLRLLDAVDGIAELCLIRQDGRPNAFNEELIQDLEEATEEIHQRTPNLRGVVVSCAGPLWMGGLSAAECRRLQSQSEEQVRVFSATGMRALNYFQEIEVPTIAVLSGHAFGCGLELALAMDVRIATANVVMGFTEKEFGFMPALMGPWRMAGICGIAPAFEWAHTGAVYSAAAAKNIGLVADIVKGDARQAIENILDAMGEGTAYPDLRKRLISRPPKEGPSNERPPEVAEQAKFAREAVRRHRMDANLPAPNEVIAALEETVCLKRDRVSDPWAIRFARVARTTATDAVLSLVPAQDSARNLAKRVQRSIPEMSPVGLFGGGAIAGSVAASLVSEAQVKSVSPTTEESHAARSEFDAALLRRLQRRASSPEALSSASDRMVHLTDAKALDDCKVVIDVRLATGAPQPRGRSFWIGDMPDPKVFESDTMLARTVGLTLMPMSWRSGLALLTFGPKSDPVAKHVGMAMGIRMGLNAIPVRPTPAGLVHRIFFAGVMGFIDLLHHGEDYRRADMLLRREGWPLGIGEMLDGMGADAVRYRMGLLKAAFPERFETGYTTAIEALASRNRRFYLPDRSVDEVSSAILKSNRAGTEYTLSNQKVSQHIIYPMILEAIRCHDEGVAPSASGINLACVLAQVFPLHRGGPLKMLEMVGLQSIALWANDNPSLGALAKPSDSFKQHYQQRSAYA